MESVIESLFNDTFENNTWSLIGAYSMYAKCTLRSNVRGTMARFGVAAPGAKRRRSSLLEGLYGAKRACECAQCPILLDRTLMVSI